MANQKRLPPSVVAGEFSTAFSASKSGWLKKLSGRGVFHKKYFCLYPHALIWTSKDGTRLSGVVPLSTFHFADLALDKDKTGKRFDVLIDGVDGIRHTITLHAEDVDEAEEWVTALKIAHVEYRSIPAQADEALKGPHFWKKVQTLHDHCHEYEVKLGPELLKSRRRTRHESLQTPTEIALSLSRAISPVGLRGQRGTLPIEIPQSRHISVRSVPLTSIPIGMGNSPTSPSSTPHQNQNNSQHQDQNQNQPPADANVQKGEDWGDGGQSEREKRVAVVVEKDPNIVGHRTCYLQGPLKVRVIGGLGAKSYKAKYAYLYDNALELAPEKGSQITEEHRLELVEGVYPNNLGEEINKGFRFDCLLRTSSEMARNLTTETVALFAETNTQRNEWIRVLKERLFMLHVTKGDEESERKAMVVGQMPELFGDDFTYVAADHHHQTLSNDLRKSMFMRGKSIITP